MSSNRSVRQFAQTMNLALPVNMIHFTASCEGNQAVLNWATSSESNSKGFGIQRSSDSRNWQTVGFVSSKATNGASKAINQYQFIDHNTASGTHYYRLKMTDMDGPFAYSNIASVSFADVADDAFLDPSPATAISFMKP